MPRKRIKSRRKYTINLKILTDDLYKEICHKTTMKNLFRSKGFGAGGSTPGVVYKPHGWLWDKDDPVINKKIWAMHKDKVMRIWQTDINKTGSKPWLCLECEKIYKQ